MSKFNRCFIAEKGSLGNSIAKILAKQKGVSVQAVGKTHVIVGDDVVTWFGGHVFENAPPKEYGYTFGDLNNMPVIIDDDKWLMNLKDGWFGKQAKAAHAVVLESNEIVNAGDAEREGQLLIDEALVQWNIDPYSSKVKRVWIKSPTDKGMLEAIENISPNAEYKSVNDSALARARADWMHGMTMTGMFTTFTRLAGGSGLISIGRVQTVILRIIVDRDMERINFKAVDYFRPSIISTHANGSFSAVWQYNKENYLDGLITDKAVIDNLSSRVLGKTGIVKLFTKTPKMEAPPLTFSLSTLNIFCSNRFGMTSDRVLEIAQSLYEKKITSYPRTDSEYLNSDQFDDAAVVVDCLKGIPSLTNICNNANIKLKSKVWNSSKVTDHYALIPTEEATPANVAQLNPDERKVFDIIAKRYLAQFYPERKWDAINAIIKCDEDEFKANGNQQTFPGWKVVFDGIPEEDEEDKVKTEDDNENTLPAMSVGDSVSIDKFEYGANKTKRPPALNDGTLEQFLNNPHLLEKDPEVRKKIKETDGIGRTSTRPPIIKVLLDRGYIVRGKRKKTELESTELGRSLINELPEEIKAIGMTAIWEGYLEQIRQEKLSLEKFLQATKEDLKRKSKMFIDKYGKTGLKLSGMKKNELANFEPIKGDGEKCQKCGEGIMKTFAYKSKADGKIKYALSCRNEDGSKRDCDNIIFENTVKPIKGDGERCPKCGKGIMKTFAYKSKADGKTKYALSCKNEDGSKSDCDNIIFENTRPPVKPIKGDGEKCSKCGKGIMKTFSYKSKSDGKIKYALSCRNEDGSKRDCDNIIFENTVKPIKGDGEKCPMCGKGILRTIKFKKDGKDYIKLVCKDEAGNNEACKKFLNNNK